VIKHGESTVTVIEVRMSAVSRQHSGAYEVVFPD
jgi:hypothetical protein